MKSGANKHRVLICDPRIYSAFHLLIGFKIYAYHDVKYGYIVP